MVRLSLPTAELSCRYGRTIRELTWPSLKQFGSFVTSLRSRGSTMQSTDSNSDNPFAKVIGLITDMIQRLQGDATRMLRRRHTATRSFRRQLPEGGRQDC